MSKEQGKFLGLFLGLFVVTMIGQYLNLFHISEHYHEFIDIKSIFGINNFFDTISNFGFLIVGLIFIKEILLKDEKDINLILVAIGTILVFFGSSYYHLLPDNSRLLWDRLPISIVFSSVLSYSLHINNLIKEEWKNKFNISYLIFSISSVIVWYVGSTNNQNILGPYVFIQFGGMIALIYIAFNGKAKDFNKKIIAVLTWYILAKLCEHYDDSIYQLTKNLVSGHTLKHILSAIALYQWFPKENKEKCIKG